MGRALSRRETDVDVVRTATMTNGCLPPTWCCSLLPIACDLRFLWIELFDMILRSLDMQAVYYLVSKCSFQRKWWHARTHASSTKHITERESFCQTREAIAILMPFTLSLGEKKTGSAHFPLLAARLRDDGEEIEDYRRNSSWVKVRAACWPRTLVLIMITSSFVTVCHGERWPRADMEHNAPPDWRALHIFRERGRRHSTNSHTCESLPRQSSERAAWDGRCCWMRRWQEEARFQRATCEHASRTTVSGGADPHARSAARASREHRSGTTGLRSWKSIGPPLRLVRPPSNLQVARWKLDKVNSALMPPLTAENAPRRSQSWGPGGAKVARRSWRRPQQKKPNTLVIPLAEHTRWSKPCNAPWLLPRSRAWNEKI